MGLWYSTFVLTKHYNPDQLDIVMEYSGANIQYFFLVRLSPFVVFGFFDFPSAALCQFAMNYMDMVRRIKVPWWIISFCMVDDNISQWPGAWGCHSQQFVWNVLRPLGHFDIKIQGAVYLCECTRNKRKLVTAGEYLRTSTWPIRLHIRL